MLLRNKFRPLGKIYKSTLLKQATSDPRKESFLSVFPEVLDSLTKSSVYANSPTFLNHYEEVLEYNVLKEKRFRPSILLDAYQTLEQPENLTADNVHLANILAWCIELIHTSIIINDDLMDHSETRDNEIPWYLKSAVGLNAANDAMLVIEGAFTLLNKYFSKHQKYLPLSDLLRFTNMSAAVGQSLDWKCNSTDKPAYQCFNIANYKTTTRYKACIPFVENPFRAALVLSNNEFILKQIIDVIIKLGEAFQIDNDILDVYDNGKVRSQIGNDISEGKCTWLAIQVLQHGNDDLKRTFKENYGRPGKEFEMKIIDVYTTMNLFGAWYRILQGSLSISIKVVRFCVMSSAGCMPSTSTATDDAHIQTPSTREVGTTESIYGGGCGGNSSSPLEDNQYFKTVSTEDV